MMHIDFSPVRRDETLSVERDGDTLIVNGEPFDLSPLPEGATLPPKAIESDWFAGPVSRIDGALHLCLTLPHGPDAPEETRFPEPITDPPDGPITLPPYMAEE